MVWTGNLRAKFRPAGQQPTFSSQGDTSGFGPRYHAGKRTIQARGGFPMLRRDCNLRAIAWLAALWLALASVSSLADDNTNRTGSAGFAPDRLAKIQPM